MAGAIRGMQVGRPEAKPQPRSVSIREPQRVAVSPDERSNFARNMGNKFMTTVELDIPRGLDMASVLEGARFLHQRGIDAINITDGARARLRMSSIAISAMIQREVGMETMTHLTTRDRNMVGLQSELMGAHAFGLRNILCITGDPTSIGDYPHATSVFDIDSPGLIRAVKSMNEGRDLLGNSIGGGTSFYIACAVNPVADDMDREIRKLEKKVAAGVDVMFSQPVYEMKTLERFLGLTRHLHIPLMLGILPLRSFKHAEFLHHEVPGMSIPDGIREQMRSAGDRASAQGIRISRSFLKEAKHLVAGAYMLPPFQKYQVVDELLEAVR
jgi:homocysteine S-methyltransferase